MDNLKSFDIGIRQLRDNYLMRPKPYLSKIGKGLYKFEQPDLVNVTIRKAYVKIAQQ